MQDRYKAKEARAVFVWYLSKEFNAFERQYEKTKSKTKRKRLIAQGKRIYRQIAILD